MQNYGKYCYQPSDVPTDSDNGGSTETVSKGCTSDTANKTERTVLLLHLFQEMYI